MGIAQLRLSYGIFRYIKGKKKSFDEWLATIYRASLAENWDDGRKRMIAIAKLGEAALTWQDQTGHHILGGLPRLQL